MQSSATALTHILTLQSLQWQVFVSCFVNGVNITLETTVKIMQSAATSIIDT